METGGDIGCASASVTGAGFGVGFGFSWGWGVMALGEIYGDCKADTNADDGGDTRGELYGDDSIELFIFSEGKSEHKAGVDEQQASLLLPGFRLGAEQLVLMGRPVGDDASSSAMAMNHLFSSMQISASSNKVEADNAALFLLNTACKWLVVLGIYHPRLQVDEGRSSQKPF